MKAVFVRGHTALSKAIMGVTKEPVSHCALVSGDTVIHSDLLGLRLQPLSVFLASHDVVYTVALPEDSSRLLDLLGMYDRTWYDFGALLFVGVALLGNRYLKIPLPRSNLWRNPGAWDCVEWVSEYALQESNSMMTPMELYRALSAEYDSAAVKE